MQLYADELAFRIALSLAIGLLVGLERGWRERDAAEGSRTAGFRTFGLAGLLGGLTAALSQPLGSELLLAAGLFAFAGVFGAFKLREATHDGDFSVTSAIAALSVFTLGALAVAGDYRIAAASGATVAALLASRAALHSFIRHLSWVEVRSAILLGAMTMIGLSLLPDRALDPWGGFNPWEVWFLTVLTATISYAGYIAVRVLGSARGLMISGLAGGLVSSTATVVALARGAADGQYLAERTGASILACMVSVLRVIALTAIVGFGALPEVLPALLPAAVVFAVAGATLLARRRVAQAAAGPASNPFDFFPLVGFAVFFGAVSVLGAALSDRFGSSSALAASVLSGLFDVDVATLTSLRLMDQGIAARAAASSVCAAVALNALARLSLAAFLGPRRFWLPFGAATLAAFGSGLAGFLLWPGLGRA